MESWWRQEIFLLLGAQTGLVPTQAQAVFPEGEEDMMLTICLHLVLRLRLNGIFTSSLPVCLHGMYTDNFTFLSVCSFGFFFILFIILFLVL